MAIACGLYWSALRFGTGSLIPSLIFFAMGAWPIVGFLGLDVLAIWWALRTSFRAAERRERVRVTAEAVTVSREDERGARVIWTSPTAFTGVDVDQPGEHEARVRIRIYRRRLTLGRALSPPERVEFGDALRQAIRDARSERYPHAGFSA